MKAPAIVFGMNTMFAVRQFLPEILSMVTERGMRPVVIAPGEPEDVRELSERGIELRCVAIKREISLFADLLTLFQLWRVLRVVRPAVTNMSTPKMALLGGLASCAAGVPQRLYTLRGLRYETTSGWRRRLLKLCERIACACAHQVVCISRSVRKLAIADRLVPPGSAVLLGERASEGISKRRMHRTATPDRTLRTALGIDPSAEVIGFVGRLTRDKGIHELAQAFGILKRGGRNLHLLLVGEFEAGDPVEPALRRWLHDQPEVHCTGYIPDPVPYIEAMDVFVFPTYREGLGMGLLEAAALGKPAVATRTTGVVDVVVEGVTGLLVPPRDAEGIAAAVSRILDNPVMASRMGASARRLVEQDFDNSVFLNRLGDMLERLAENDGRGKGLPATSRSRE